MIAIEQEFANRGGIAESAAAVEQLGKQLVNEYEAGKFAQQLREREEALGSQQPAAFGFAGGAAGDADADNSWIWWRRRKPSTRSPIRRSLRPRRRSEVTLMKRQLSDLGQRGRSAARSARRRWRASAPPSSSWARSRRKTSSPTRRRGAGRCRRACAPSRSRRRRAWTTRSRMRSLSRSLRLASRAVASGRDVCGRIEALGDSVSKPKGLRRLRYAVLLVGLLAAVGAIVGVACRRRRRRDLSDRRRWHARRRLRVRPSAARRSRMAARAAALVRRCEEAAAAAVASQVGVQVRTQLLRSAARHRAQDALEVAPLALPVADLQRHLEAGREAAGRQNGRLRARARGVVRGDPHRRRAGAGARARDAQVAVGSTQVQQPRRIEPRWRRCLLRPARLVSRRSSRRSRRPALPATLRGGTVAAAAGGGRAAPGRAAPSRRRGAAPATRAGAGRYSAVSALRQRVRLRCPRRRASSSGRCNQSAHPAAVQRRRRPRRVAAARCALSRPGQLRTRRRTTARTGRPPTSMRSLGELPLRCRRRRRCPLWRHRPSFRARRRGLLLRRAPCSRRPPSRCRRRSQPVAAGLGGGACHRAATRATAAPGSGPSVMRPHRTRRSRRRSPARTPVRKPPARPPGKGADVNVLSGVYGASELRTLHPIKQTDDSCWVDHSTTQ